MVSSSLLFFTFSLTFLAEFFLDLTGDSERDLELVTDGVRSFLATFKVFSVSLFLFFLSFLCVFFMRSSLTGDGVRSTIFFTFLSDFSTFLVGFSALFFNTDSLRISSKSLSSNTSLSRSSSSSVRNSSASLSLKSLRIFLACFPALLSLSLRFLFTPFVLFSLLLSSDTPRTLLTFSLLSTAFFTFSSTSTSLLSSNSIGIFFLLLLLLRCFDEDFLSLVGDDDEVLVFVIFSFFTSLTPITLSFCVCDKFKSTGYSAFGSSSEELESKYFLVARSKAICKLLTISVYSIN